MKIKQSRTFYKYLISYATVLIIPLVIVTWFINSNFIDILKNEAETSNVNNLIKAKDQLERNFSDLDRIANSISLNSNFLPAKLQTSRVEIIEGINEIKLYKDANDFIYDIGYYIIGGNSVIMSAQYVDLKLLTENIIKFTDWKYEDIYQELNHITYPVFFSNKKVTSIDNKVKELVLYMYPVNPQHNYATVIFFIDNNRIRELLSRDKREYDEFLAVINNNGEVITSIENGLKLEDKEIKDVLGELSVQRNTTYSSYEKGDYMVSAAWSKSKQRTYLSVANKSQILQKVNKVKTNFYMFMLAAFLLGAVIIAIGVYINYIPIYRLRKLISNKFSLQGVPGTKDELEQIKMDVLKIINVNEDLASKVEQLKPILRKNALTELIKGQSPDFGYVHMEKIGDFYGDRAYIVCFAWINSEVRLEKTKVESILKQYLVDTITGTRVYFIDFEEEYKFLFVVDFPKVTNDLIEDSMSDLGKKLGDIEILFAASNLCNDILMIGQFYVEAYKNMVEQLSKKQFGLNSDILDSIEITAYPFDELKKLEVHVRNGRHNEVFSITEKVVYSLKKQTTPVFLKNCIVFDLINLCLKLAAELKVTKFENVDANYHKLFSIHDYRDFLKINSEFNQFLSELCKIASNRTGNNRLIKNISQFVNQNFKNSDLTVNSIADHFDISVPYLSQIFKQSYGSNISSHIMELRMEYAKKLLLETDLSLKQIVVEIGYSYETSFSRAFKKEEGITPIEYREKNKKKYGGIL